MFGRLLVRLGIRSSDAPSAEPSADDEGELDAGEEQDDAAADDGSGFLRSRLDASVLEAHGASVSPEPVDTDGRDQDETVREKEAAIQEHQQALEDEH